MKSCSEIDTSTVTSQQIGACYKVFVASIPFYKVQSESDPFKQYTISWSREHGFTCTCPSGQHGFSNCKDGVCKHCKWALACERETREALAELEAAIKAQAAPVATVTNVDAATLDRVQEACKKPAKVSKAKGQTRGFALMR